MTPGNLGKLLVHGGDQLFLVLVEDGTPVFFSLEVDEVFGVEEAGGIGAVVGAAGLADDLGDLRETGHHDAGLVGEVDAGGRAFAGRQRAANPDGALVEVRQELRADGTAKGQVDGDGERAGGDAEGDVAMQDGGADGDAIVVDEPLHDGVMPLFGAFVEERSWPYGSNRDGKDERAEQGKSDGPGHGLEEPAFDSLEGEDGQIGGDDDAASEEDRAQHFVGGVADFLRGGARCRPFARDGGPCSRS